MRLCELRQKEVINSCNCKRLGCVVDLEVNLCTGNVEAIITTNRKNMRFSRQ